jgi:hypothetical protein
MRAVKLVLAAAALSGGVFVSAASAVPIVRTVWRCGVEQVHLVCNVSSVLVAAETYYGRLSLTMASAASPADTLSSWLRPPLVIANLGHD